MAIHASWPTSSDEPYEVTVSYETSDHVKQLTAGNAEFDRFESLTRRLVGVSKGELVQQHDEPNDR